MSERPLKIKSKSSFRKHRARIQLHDSYYKGNHKAKRLANLQDS